MNLPASAATVAPATPATPAIRCLNCEAALSQSAPPNYCSACGQETRVRAPTLLEFVQQFGGNYVAMEGALWRTLWRLLCLPGQLTLEYLAGRRRRYVLPLRLYLTISVVTLLVMRFMASMQLDTATENIVKMDAGANKNMSVIGFGEQRAGLKDGMFYCDGLPHTMCERLKRRLTTNPESIANELREAPERFFSHLGTAMFVLLPCFALWLKLVYIDRRLRYTEHLVFALHLHAFWFAMALLALLIRLPGVLPVCGLASLLYPLVALQRVYKTRWWSTALRSLALLLLNFITLSLLLALVFAWTLVS